MPFDPLSLTHLTHLLWSSPEPISKVALTSNPSVCGWWLVTGTGLIPAYKWSSSGHLRPTYWSFTGQLTNKLSLQSNHWPDCCCLSADSHCRSSGPTTVQARQSGLDSIGARIADISFLCHWINTWWEKITFLIKGCRVLLPPVEIQDI